MSVITGPGFYRQRNGGKCEVLAERNGRWYGILANRLGVWWDSCGITHGVYLKYESDIVAVWHDEPATPAFKVGDLVLVNAPQFKEHHGCYGTVTLVYTDNEFIHVNTGKDFEAETGFPLKPRELSHVTLPAPLPEGFRLKPRNVKPVDGVNIGISSTSNEWRLVCNWRRCTAEDWDRLSKYSAPHFFAEPIPKAEPPFRISDRGCGIYETRDGRLVRVERQEQPFARDGFVWWGRCSEQARSWRDCGLYDSRNYNGPLDLVRYIGPLTEPQPEWVATNELRWVNCNTTSKDSPATWMSAGLNSFARLEQKWTCEGAEEWRAVEVQP